MQPLAVDKFPPGARVNFLAKAAALVATLTMASKVLGFVRETALAGTFGATSLTDAYLVALAVPVVFFGAAATALSTVFIPVFAETQETDGRDAANRLASTVLNATFVVALFLVALGEATAGPLAGLAGPGLSGEALGTATVLTRIIFPSVLFQALSCVCTGILQTGGNFTLPATAGLSFNGVMIGSILVFGPVFGVQAAALGVLGATATQFAIQAFGLRRSGFRWGPVLDWRNPRLKKLGVLLVPVLAGSVVARAAPVADTVLASRLDEGSLAALNFGTRLTLLPGGVFGSAIAAVLFPDLARLAALRDTGRFRSAFAGGMRMTTFLLAPMSLGLLILREPVVRLAFQRGAFSAAATQTTAVVVLFLSLGIIAFALQEVLTRAFYSLQDTGTPMLVGAGVGAAGAGLKLLLVGPWGVGGLALATSVATALGVVTLLWLLRRRLGHLDGWSVLDSFGRVLMGAGAMGLAVAVLWRWEETAWPGGGLFLQAGRLATVVLAGGILYFGATWGLRAPEAGTMLALARRAVRR